MGRGRILLRSDAVVIGDRAEVERKLSAFEVLWNDGLSARPRSSSSLAAVWEAYGTFLD